MAPLSLRDSVRYLGLTIDKDLSWKTHVSNVQKKAFAAIVCIRRASQYLPVKIRKILYNSLVLPHLDYCSTVWHSCNQTLSQSLERTQNYAMIVILSQPPRMRGAPSEARFTGLPSIDDVTTKCCDRCTGVCFSRLLSTWPGNLPRTHNSTHPPEEQTSYTSSTPAQTSLDCPSSTMVLTTTTSCHKMSDQSKAYHLLGMQ